MKKYSKEKKEESLPAKTTKVRPKVPCNCKKCNGKLVDTRTRQKHEIEENRFQDSISNRSNREKDKGKDLKSIDEPSDSNSVSDEVQPNVSGFSQNLYDDDAKMLDSDHDQSDEEGFVIRSVNIKKKRRRYDRFRETNDIIIITDEESEQQVNSSGDEEGEERSQSADDEDDDIFFDEDENPNLFATPESAHFNYDSDDMNVDEDVNSNSWILLWIFKYQERFKLSDVAINSLIGFFSLVLKDINLNRFKKFPSTAYTARRLLEIKKKPTTFAACPDCDKLYDIATIIATNTNNENSGFKCTYVEFSNHPMQSQRKSCGSELLMKVPVNNGYIWRPKMVYPLPCLKTQVSTMYQRPGFEELLNKWASRDHENSLMSDIYDGEIWKTFPSDTDNLHQSQFFTAETADSHLGLMINLDWFQPFDSASYSTGAIYGVICNLPRDVRFKKENMLTLGLLPGPKEVKLHRINHYLAPIVDELLEFWDGVYLPATDKYPAGRRVRMAVICCSNDIPAARKLCGHISALVGCHRCYKRASSEEGQKLNFGGFDDMNDWFRTRDPEEHRRNAMLWKHLQTKDDRKRHVSRTHVRWSELLRLPYHNPVRHLVVDPMHNLFLGIAHWIVKRLWIDNGIISKSHLELMETRAKNIKIPADLGRIPHKIATGEGFSGFTADQWKSFILIYAIPLMWDILPESDQKILANFVRACSLLVSRIIDNNALDEAQSRLFKLFN